MQVEKPKKNSKCLYLGEDDVEILYRNYKQGRHDVWRRLSKTVSKVTEVNEANGEVGLRDCDCV